MHINGAFVFSLILNILYVYKYSSKRKEVRNLNITEFLSDLKLFFHGAFDLKNKSTAIIKKEAEDELDNFLLLCFSDLLGIPNPISYYTLEVLPYVAEELDDWELRILGRKSVLAEKAAAYDADP